MEFIIASLLASMLLTGLVLVIYLPLRITKRTDDVNAAQTRAEMVFSILRNPLEQCGYGMPKEETAYRNGFGASAAPFNWPGPISVSTAATALWTREKAVCKIAYGEETKIRTLADSVVSGDRMEVRVTGVPSMLEGSAGDNYSKNIVKNWVLSGAMMPDYRPLIQYAPPKKLPEGGAVLSLRLNSPLAGSDMFIPENDELFYLRAMECTIMKRDDDYAFVTNDYTGSGWQPRVTGVVDVRFEMDGSGRLLKVITLTRGKWRYDEIVTGGLPKGWPEQYRSAIPDDARHYRLIASEATFALKNF
jgi:hypothetical protein